MKAELFSAGCRLCEGTEDVLRRTFPHLHMEVHRASECTDGSCCALAAEYGIRAVPSLVLDGQVALVGVPSEQDIRALAARLSVHTAPL